MKQNSFKKKDYILNFIDNINDEVYITQNYLGNKN